MKRRRFLADALMAIAVSLVPKILQPVEVVEESRSMGIIWYIKNYGSVYYPDPDFTLEKMKELIANAAPPGMSIDIRYFQKLQNNNL